MFRTKQRQEKKKQFRAKLVSLDSVQICGVDLLITIYSCKIEICHNFHVIYWIKWMRIVQNARLWERTEYNWQKK